jgi:hypothetical protein
MKRKGLLIIAAAAGAAALVVLTTGAVAGTTGRSQQPGGAPTVDFTRFVSCLRSHGVQVPSNDPATVKQWLGQHSQDDPAVQAALNACAPANGGGGKAGNGTTAPGPTPAQLIACLEQHRIDVPSDVKQAPDTIKQWLVRVMDQPRVRAALDACVGSPPTGPQKK